MLLSVELTIISGILINAIDNFYKAKPLTFILNNHNQNVGFSLLMPIQHIVKFEIVLGLISNNSVTFIFIKTTKDRFSLCYKSCTCLRLNACWIIAGCGRKCLQYIYYYSINVSPRYSQRSLASDFFYHHNITNI